ncbi:MAG: hypothetical protein HOY75_13365 [Streptomyces sp.]|nr:hypothetical protein [Streptomyces sp.]
MIAEAVDTAVTVAWALLAWITAMAVVATVVLYAVAVTIAVACRALRRGVKAALAASQRLKAPESHPEPQRPPEARTGPRVPSWADTDKDAA